MSTPPSPTKPPSTLLCVPLMVDDVDDALDAARLAKDRGADLVEFRIDRLFHGHGDDDGQRRALRLTRESPLPCIITCRPTYEGGEYDGEDANRVSLFEHLATSDHPPRYIDVELAAYTRSANLRQKVNLTVDHDKQQRHIGTSLILSTHDFETRPPDLLRRLAAMRAEHACRVIKLAFRARSLRDNLELFDLLAERDRPMIALAMGDFGVMSRVLAPKFNAFLTFAALDGHPGTAPGQPTLGELLGLYRFRSITPHTRVYGIIGWPVAHSMSPHVHNAVFRSLGHDAVYLRLPVQAGDDGAASYESLKATLPLLIDHPRLHFAGASVTIPHKESLVRLALELGWSIDPDAAAMGAANTVTVDRDSAGGVTRVHVCNTDAPAAVESLQQHGPIAGRRVLVLGTGGVSRAIAFALARAGAEVLAHGRSMQRTQLFAQDVAKASRGSVHAVASPVDAAGPALHAIVNGTPVGMISGPDPAGTPVDLDALVAAHVTPVVFDTVYNPVETPLLAAARRLALPTVDGVAMFTRQAARQAQLWTDSHPPIGLIEQVVRDQLANRH